MPRATVAVVAGTVLLVAGCTGADRSRGMLTVSASAAGTASSRVPADGVLTDAGIGELRLGDDVRVAIARGLVGSKGATRSDCTRYDGRHGVAVLIADERGRISAIAVRASVRTAQGVGVGSTYREIHAAHPDAEAGYGKVEAPAPLAPVPAHYLFGTDSGDVVYPSDTVVSVALVSERSACTP